MKDNITDYEYHRAIQTISKYRLQVNKTVDKLTKAERIPKETKFEDIHLSVGLFNVLNAYFSHINSNERTLSILEGVRTNDLLRCRGFGKKKLAELINLCISNDINLL